MNVSQGRLAVPKVLEDSVKALMAHLGELGRSVSWDSASTAIINTSGSSQVLLQVGHRGELKRTIFFIGSNEDVLGSLSDYAGQHGLTIIPISRRESQVDAALSPRDRYDSESVFAEFGGIIKKSSQSYR